jgi:hypothetical protein
MELFIGKSGFRLAKTLLAHVRHGPQLGMSMVSIFFVNAVSLN